MTGITLLTHDKLQPSPLNPRKHARSPAEIAELAASIADKGILQNLVVRQVNGHFEIAAGEGRYRAVAHLIDAGTVAADYELPVMVRELTDQDIIEIGLIENTQRNDLHPLDEARAYLALYEMRAAAGGKKAAAKAIAEIAASIKRTTRYVQKRVKIARDLIPEWTDLLERDLMSVAAAQILATAEEDDQREALRLVQDGFGSSLRINDAKARGLSVKEITSFISEGSWRPMKSALFDIELYDGETDEIDGEIYATDRNAFDTLQKDAAAAIVREARKQVKAEEIEFIEQGENFVASRYDQRKLADGSPDPAGGIFVLKHRDGEIRVIRGLFKTDDAKEADAREAARKVKQAKDRAKQKKQRESEGVGAPRQQKPEDPRIKIVAAKLEEDRKLAVAVGAFLTLSAYNEHPDWLDHDLNEKRAREAATRLAGGTLPKGVKLLTWLIDQKPSVVNEIVAHGESAEVARWRRVEMIAKPSPVEQLLFDLCGAKLPDELALERKPKNAKTAGKKLTASKSKPTPKKKGKKS